MTLIASLFPFGHPCLIGDVVESSDTSPAVPVRIPTVIDSSRVQGSDERWFISGLRQKLVVPHPKLAFAWSGRLRLAEKIAADLSNLMVTSSTPDVDIEIYIRNFGSTADGSDISIVGVMQSDDQFVNFSLGAESFYTQKYGNVAFAGTGADEIISAMKIIEQKLPNNSENPIVSAVLVSQSIADELIVAELDEAASLAEYYGGAYEIITWLDGQFQKIRPKNFLQSQIILSHKQYFGRPLIFMKQDYFRDLLLVYSVDYRNEPIVRRVEPVCPVGKELSSYSEEEIATARLPPKTLESEWLSNYVKVTSDFSELESMIIDTSCSFGYKHNVSIQGNIRNIDVSFRPKFATTIYNEYVKSILAVESGLNSYTSAYYRENKE